MFHHIAENKVNLPSLINVYDASYGINVYDQTVFITGLFYSDSMFFFHRDWESHKKSKIKFTSVWGKIMVATNSVDRSSLLCESVQNAYHHPTSYTMELFSDSFGLFGTINLLREGNECRLSLTISRITGAFQSSKISLIMWNTGSDNIAKHMTKYSPYTREPNSTGLTTGKLIKFLFVLLLRKGNQLTSKTTSPQICLEWYRSWWAISRN